MELDFFTEIMGVGAASGIHYQEENLYLIGDNSAYLYQYNVITGKLGKKQVLSTGSGAPMDSIAKIDKPDFESLCFYKSKLYLLGSGSTRNRNRMVVYCIDNQRSYEQDLSGVYADLILQAALGQGNLNIEGAICMGQEWLLFNRGNGSQGRNGIFKMEGGNLTQPRNVQFIPIALPQVDHVVSSFTDAVRVEDKIYFLTTAEDTVSTYDDGKVLGSWLGCMELDSLKIAFVLQLSDSHKFEGITLYERDEDEITFLLCEDKDSEEMSSCIYKLSHRY